MARSVKLGRPNQRQQAVKEPIKFKMEGNSSETPKFTFTTMFLLLDHFIPEEKGDEKQKYSGWRELNNYGGINLVSICLYEK